MICRLHAAFPRSCLWYKVTAIGPNTDFPFYGNAIFLFTCFFIMSSHPKMGWEDWNKRIDCGIVILPSPSRLDSEHDLSVLSKPPLVKQSMIKTGCPNGSLSEGGSRKRPDQSLNAGIIDPIHHGIRFFDG